MDSTDWDQTNGLPQIQQTASLGEPAWSCPDATYEAVVAGIFAPLAVSESVY